MRGSAFLRSLPPGGDARSIEVREDLVLDALRRGVALPIVWAPVHTEDKAGHKGIVYVSSDTLRFGIPGPNANPDDWDWVRMALTADGAQRVADALGVLLPTDKIADLAHAQADVRLHPHVQGAASATLPAIVQAHADIEAERAGRDGLLSTIGKDWVVTNALFPPPWGGLPPHRFGYDGAVNYGWHTVGPVSPDGPYMGQPGVILWQTLGQRHNRKHVDNSQLQRLVRDKMQVLADGNWVWKPTAEVMRSPEFSGLVSYEGPLRGTRHPDRAQNRTAAQSSSRSEAPEAGSLSDPFDDLQAKRNPHVCACCRRPVWWEKHETTRARELAIRCGFCLGIFCLPCALVHFGAVR